MNELRPKQPRLRVDAESYDQLRNQVLRRDGWRCQSCGAMSNLEVHHKQFRSQSRDDSSQNLITLCTACHAKVHRSKVSGAMVQERQWYRRSSGPSKAGARYAHREHGILS